MKRRKMIRASVMMALVFQCFFVWSLVAFLLSDGVTSHPSGAVPAGSQRGGYDHHSTASSYERGLSLLDGLPVLSEMKHIREMSQEIYLGASGSRVDSVREVPVYKENKVGRVILRVSETRFWFMSLALVQLLMLSAVLVAEERQATRFAKQAYHDELTGLPNRSNLRMYLRTVCSDAEVSGEVVIVAFIDLDKFKWANDEMGHDAGDAVLKQVANCLRLHCREGDFVGRYGGDEFVVVFISPALQREQSIRRLHRVIIEAFDDVARDPLCENIGASCGVSVFPVDATGVDKLIWTADKAMYQAKRRKRGRVSLVQYHAPADKTVNHTDGNGDRNDRQSHSLAAVEAEGEKS